MLQEAHPLRVTITCDWSSVPNRENFAGAYVISYDDRPIERHAFRYFQTTQRRTSSVGELFVPLVALASMKSLAETITIRTDQRDIPIRLQQYPALCEFGGVQLKWTYCDSNHRDEHFRWCDAEAYRFASSKKTSTQMIGPGTAKLLQRMWWFISRNRDAVKGLHDWTSLVLPKQEKSNEVQ